MWYIKERPRAAGLPGSGKERKMNEQKGNIINGSDDPGRRDPWFDPENDIILSGSDKELFGMISDYMTGKFDIEDVNNDPLYEETDRIVAGIISEYKNKAVHNKINEMFIKENFSSDIAQEEVGKEILNIKKEINERNLDNTAADWVKKWNDAKQKNTGDPKKKEIRDFVTGSIDNYTVFERSSSAGMKKSTGRSLYIRYIALAAAVIAGAVFIIKALVISDDPERLFNNYYQPLSVIP